MTTLSKQSANKRRPWFVYVVAAAILLLIVVIAISVFKKSSRDSAPANGSSPSSSAAPSTPPTKPSTTQQAATATKPVLSVQVVKPQRLSIPIQLTANGNLVPWQEVMIGAELSGLRIQSLRAQVGDHVKAGQVLAVLDASTTKLELQAAESRVDEAKAQWQEAVENAKRGRALQGSGAVADQVIEQWIHAERASHARLLAAQAQRDTQRQRQRYTQVVAPDQGTITARMVGEGDVTQPGQGLFKLMRQDRLEWQAELMAEELQQYREQLIKADVRIDGLEGQDKTKPMVRAISRQLDTTSRRGLVYVSLPTAMTSNLRAGQFLRGTFILGQRDALVVPQTAVSLREGFAYVFILAEDQRVRRVKVSLGARDGQFLEIQSGLSPEDVIVADGVAFLADRDRVKVLTP